MMDERNKDFRDLYQRVGESGQDALLDHILSPFETMQAVITNDNGEWDLEDSKISVYTYISLLGSGFLDGVIVFVLQLAMPVMLALYYSTREDDGEGSPGGTREMLFTVLVYYLVKVNQGEVPKTSQRRLCCKQQQQQQQQ